MSTLTDLIEPNNLRLFFSGVNGLRDVVQEVRDDSAFARTLVRAALPPWRGRKPRPPGDVFPPLEPFDVRALRGKRVGLVASGGSGALASLCGVRRALEEADVRVVEISACSGANLFASLWALELGADEMAHFWLSLRTKDYVDPDWRGLAGAPLRRFRGWTGILAGDAVERTFRERFGDIAMRDLSIPLHMPVWNVDTNTLEYFGTRETPDLPLATAIRVAISIPIFVRAVRVGDHLYGDGGIVNVFPTRPIVEAGVDVVIGVNCYFPQGFEGENLTGWETSRWSIMQASTQLRSCVHIELAREEARQLGNKLILLNPVPYTDIRGARFYETFLDRARWPEFMQMGRASAREALARFAPATETALPETALPSVT